MRASVSTEQYVSILKEWIPKEASVAIAVDGNYVHYAPGIHDIQIEVGQSVKSGCIAMEVSEKNCKVERNIESSIFGQSYYGIGYPFTLEEKEGVVVVILPPAYYIVKKPPLTFLTGRYEDSWHPVSVEKISHIESWQKKTWFYRTDDAYQSIYTLKELAEQLPSHFLRIHRSYIINIQHIIEISRDFSSNMLVTLKNGTVLPVSQSYSTQVRKALGF